MKKKKSEIDMNSLIDKARRVNKRNFTFRFDPEVVEGFKAACERYGVKPGAAIESFMLHFAKQGKGK